ncbi:T9SS type A sorting domain-containing protein [Bacteroidota bacterium]
MKILSILIFLQLFVYSGFTQTDLTNEKVRVLNQSLNQNIVYTDLYGPYFGQELPGNEPQYFAHGIIDTKVLHCSPSFSPDGTEMIWSEVENDWSSATIYYSRMINNRWTEPAVVSFSSPYFDDNPVFSPDGQKLFFNSDRLYNGYAYERVWYVTRQNDGGWSEPLPLDPIINNYPLHWQTSIDNNGTIYFGSERTPNYGEDDIFYSHFVNGHYESPINMGPLINTGACESMPYVDPQTRYILFERPVVINGQLKNCIMFCKRDENRIWADLINITVEYPDIYGACPQITPDGNYLFFTRYVDGHFHVFWVQADFINELYLGTNNFEQKQVNIELFQNYPNPFKSDTNISFKLNEGGKISLKIINIRGQVMETIINNSFLNQGTHTYKFNADSFSNGMYYYMLIHENSQSRILKMCKID